MQVAVVPAHKSITSRPLFASNGARSPSTGALDAITLVGVAKNQSQAIGVIRTPGGPSRAVHAGDQIGDWYIVSIHENKITLRRNNDVRELKVGASAIALQVATSQEGEEVEQSE